MTTSNDPKSQAEVSVCRHAVETGQLYGHAVTELRKQGQIGVLDYRVSMSLVDPMARVDDPFPEFLVEVSQCHEAVSLACGTQPAFRSALAVQRKLIRAAA